MITEIDKALMLALNFDGGTILDSFFWIVTKKFTWIPLYAFLIYLLWQNFGWKYTLIALLIAGAGVGLADQIAGFFKHNLPKTRPTHTPEIAELVHTVNGYRGGLYGTVSAHAATTFHVAVYCSSLLKRRWLTVLLFIWTALVCYSRIYLGVHWPFDILSGIALGTVIGFCMVKLMGLCDKRWHLRAVKPRVTI